MMTFAIFDDPTPRILPAGHTHVWLAETAALQTPELLAAYQALLSPEECEQHRRFRFETNRHEYLVTRALVRWVLSFYRDVEPEAWRFERTSFGQPYVSAPTGTVPHFSLSNADGLVACAVSDDSVGVDVEKTSRGAEVLDLASSVFSPAEQGDLMALAEDLRPLRAIQLWTLKEAYLKALGTGLSTPLQSFSLAFGPETISLHSPLPDRQEDWRLATGEIGLHQMGVACRRTGNTDRTIKIRRTVPLVRW
ncbi:4'-phosphopantetheinyl transferase superfamily protein [Telmatospirillum sp.]|uniref:4'-phosphopantetheinyl transferase family protein n=1 Tax=Telmatospirillum sp. TaxID=2079197 RepID=UPI0028402FC2|nr:4'-phosphopantetheinyl transferase superfamily protein [Telmatospirillum sp.]MDR3439528.1 4'-phosphopantetheinyl transferase superfamily protein [Telmatospirillum sp.]